MIINFSKKILNSSMLVIFLFNTTALLARENMVSCRCEGSSIISENGVVPDEETAKKIAEAILIPIYGQYAIEKQKPFSVSMENETWVVSGYLSEYTLGGVFLIVICKQNGRVIKIAHGR